MNQNRPAWHGSRARNTADGAAIWLVAAVALAAQAAAQGASNSSLDSPEAALREHVQHLASDELDGRLTGTTGERAAAQYLAGELRALGATPLPGHTSFEQTFEFTAGSRDVGTRLETTVGGRTSAFEAATGAITALAFSEPGLVEGEVVFAGYGLEVPDGNEFGYDSYAGLDVRDKVVLVLRYSPEDATGEVRTTLARYSGLRYKAMLARRHGARALLVVTGPRSAGAGELVPMTFDTAAAGSAIVAASVTGDVASSLFASLPGRDLEAVQRELDGGNPHVAGFALPGVSVRLDVRLERERHQGTNVVGMLRGSAPPATDGYVVVGAHFDHLGRGRGGNSLARVEEAGAIHYGADDNASGVAAVLEAGRALRSERFERNVVLAFWSGEELGLLGSNDFLARGGIPPADIAAYLNLDMVGRMRANRLTAQGTGSSPEWARLLEQANVLAGFDLSLQSDPYLPTDSAAFYGAQVPTLNLFTGAHEDYHRPTDRPDRINFADLERVSDLTKTLTLRLANAATPPEYARVERSAREVGDRDTVRVYTGTIPDYATEVEGLLLGGVVGGGPAEAAGLRAGDVIVRFGEHDVKNIYDYTYALDAAKVDVPLEVVYLRDGQRLTTTITPRARK